jgi:hypothetical protein
MASLDRQPQAKFSQPESLPAWTQEAEAPCYDARGRHMMPRRAIRHGLVFCVVFYTGLGTVIGGVIWLIRRFL